MHDESYYPVVAAMRVTDDSGTTLDIVTLTLPLTTNVALTGGLGRRAEGVLTEAVRVERLVGQ